MMMAREVQLKVADAKQRDVGHGKARIDNETMLKLAITAGDVIDVRGKRTTVAIAWPAYAEDQGQELGSAVPLMTTRTWCQSFFLESRPE